MKKWYQRWALIGNYLGIAGFWGGAWLFRALSICLTGGILGALFSPLLRLVFFRTSDTWGAVSASFWMGFKYFGIWSIGIAMMWTIMERKSIANFANKRFQPLQGEVPQ